MKNGNQLWSSLSSGEKLQITSTEASYSYYDGIIVMQDFDYIIYEVKTCSGALIALQHIPGVIHHGAYEIAIGIDNAKGIAFRNEIGGSNIIENQTDSELVNCDNYQSFWVRWDEDRRFFVGRGSKVLLDIIVSYTPEQYYMPNAVSFTTQGDSEGVWRLLETGSKNNFCHQSV